jgi:glycosyltransferase involved in cell wall biosynthesis
VLVHVGRHICSLNCEEENESFLMQHVLIPSDDIAFVPNLALGYQSQGYSATGGSINFALETGNYDIVHFLWPEEFTNWRLPTQSQIEAIVARLDRWSKVSRLIISVHNLYPHGYSRNPLFHRLFTDFYMRCEVIHHFSQVSKDMVCAEFPTIANRNHVVRVGFNYERCLRYHRSDRDEARRLLGIESDQLVFVVVGELRFWEEVRLLMSAFDLARVPKKRLIMARYSEMGPRWVQRWRRWRLAGWQRLRGVRSLTEWVPEEELLNLVIAADAVVVIRKNALGSGVPSLAMTLGRFVVAPNIGAMREYLTDTGNALYDPSSIKDLASAMERAASAERDSVGLENARVAADWGWQSIVGTCLEALPKSIPDSTVA